MVDFVVTFCRNVHRSHFAGANRPGVFLRGSDRALCDLRSLVLGVWRDRRIPIRKRHGDLSGGIVNSATVLFQMLAAMPLASVTSMIAIGLLVVFIVTSADSGALVVDTITSGGKTDAPRFRRHRVALMP